MRAKNVEKSIIFNGKIYDLIVPTCPACERYVATLEKCPNCGMKIEHRKDDEE